MDCVLIAFHTMSTVTQWENLMAKWNICHPQLHEDCRCLEDEVTLYTWLSRIRLQDCFSHSTQVIVMRLQWLGFSCQPVHQLMPATGRGALLFILLWMQTLVTSTLQLRWSSSFWTKAPTSLLETGFRGCHFITSLLRLESASHLQLLSSKLFFNRILKI